jgi:transcription initiation factor TFIIIB Brf1 subunit/transcription initiation factor TFIIB
MTKKTIPEIREEMFELANQMQLMARRMKMLAQETYRRSYERAPVRSRRITQRVRAEVHAYRHENPTASFQDIANAFGINPGRVSEILHGKRG